MASVMNYDSTSKRVLLHSVSLSHGLDRCQLSETDLFFVVFMKLLRTRSTDAVVVILALKFPVRGSRKDSLTVQVQIGIRRR